MFVASCEVCIKNICNKYIKFLWETSRGACAQSVTVKSTGCGFDPHSRKWNIYTFIFPFLRSGVEAKRDVECRHSTRNASRTWWNWRTECLNSRFPLPTLLCAGYSIKHKGEKKTWYWLYLQVLFPFFINYICTGKLYLCNNTAYNFTYLEIYVGKLIYLFRYAQAVGRLPIRS